jgi:Arc/MetJ-type ribon-helix-helix transcriptional regulator
MAGKKKDSSVLRVVVPKSVRYNILSSVKYGKYKSISDFLRKAIKNQLENEDLENKDLLEDQSFKKFIEKIS